MAMLLVMPEIAEIGHKGNDLFLSGKKLWRFLLKLFDFCLDSAL